MSPTSAQEIPENNKISVRQLTELSETHGLCRFPLGDPWNILWISSGGFSLSPETVLQGETSQSRSPHQHERWELCQTVHCLQSRPCLKQSIMCIKARSVRTIKPPVIVLLLTWLCFSSLPSSSEAATDMTESQLRQTEISDRNILSVVCSVERQWRDRDRTPHQVTLQVFCLSMHLSNFTKGQIINFISLGSSQKLTLIKICSTLLLLSLSCFWGR